MPDDLTGSLWRDVVGLAGCTDLASVQLQCCESLENVNGLAGCAKLTYLFIFMCDRVVPQPPTAALTTRKKIAAYQKLLKA